MAVSRVSGLSSACFGSMSIAPPMLPDGPTPQISARGPCSPSTGSSRFTGMWLGDTIPCRPLRATSAAAPGKPRIRNVSWKPPAVLGVRAEASLVTTPDSVRACVSAMNRSIGRAGGGGGRDGPP
nr:hypothetical protein [Burkholderia plantarii]